MKMLPHIASRVLGTPLVIGQAKLEAILSVLGPRIGIEAPATVAFTDEPARPQSATVTSSRIAVIPVFGTLVKRAGPIEAASGLTSYGDLETEILDAATDPAVRAIVLDVDSPGGEASGVFDLADLVFEARSLKPVWAVADEEAFSGAYAIASAAERVIVPRTGGVGSIGVVAVHVDRSARDVMEGYRYTTVFAGAHKNDFNPHEALGGEARTALQAEVDRVHGLFVETVARNRGMAAAAVRETEAGLFFGEAAVRAGLADEVGTMRDALAALAAAMSGPRPMIRGVTATASPASPEVLHTPPIVKEESMTDAITETAKPGGTAPPAENKTGSDPGTDIAVETDRKTAEVVDLDKVRAEARGEGAAEAARIADLCALAGMPERTGEMIGRGLSADEVRKELLALKAGEDGAEVRSHVLPGAGTGQPLDLNDNPVVGAAKARAAAAKEA
jgi:signal peptide peptidase SppA